MQRKSFRSCLDNFVGLGLAGTVACSIVTTTATPAGAVVLPDPCSLAPAGLVVAALGVPAATLHGVLKTYKGKYPLEECVFTHSSVYAEVGVAPAAYGEGAPAVRTAWCRHIPAGSAPRASSTTTRIRSLRTPTSSRAPAGALPSPTHMYLRARSSSSVATCTSTAPSRMKRSTSEPVSGPLLGTTAC
jgi:hypothetical protein